jgi:hypothetical protein
MMRNCKGLQLLMSLTSSADWETTSVAQLAQCRPQQGLEIRRSLKSLCRPLNAVIAGPGIFVRKIHLPGDTVKRWLAINWKKIQAAVNLFQISYQPYANSRETCLALREFVSGKWVSVYEDGNSVNVDWLPIALGCTTGNQSLPVWDNIRLHRPTMRAKLGMGNGKVYNINFIVNYLE